MTTRIITYTTHNSQQLAIIISAIKPGHKFAIKHCDGVVVNETVAAVKWQDPQYFYVCESCACYCENDLKNI